MPGIWVRLKFVHHEFPFWRYRLRRSIWEKRYHLLRTQRKKHQDLTFSMSFLNRHLSKNHLIQDTSLPRKQLLKTMPKMCFQRSFCFGILIDNQNWREFPENIEIICTIIFSLVKVDFNFKRARTSNKHYPCSGRSTVLHLK